MLWKDFGQRLGSITPKRYDPEKLATKRFPNCMFWTSRMNLIVQKTHPCAVDRLPYANGTENAPTHYAVWGKKAIPEKKSKFGSKSPRILNRSPVGRPV